MNTTAAYGGAEYPRDWSAEITASDTASDGADPSGWNSKPDPSGWNSAPDSSGWNHNTNRYDGTGGGLYGGRPVKPVPRGCPHWLIRPGDPTPENHWDGNDSSMHESTQNPTQNPMTGGASMNHSAANHPHRNEMSMHDPAVHGASVNSQPMMNQPMMNNPMMNQPTMNSQPMMNQPMMNSQPMMNQPMMNSQQMMNSQPMNHPMMNNPTAGSPPMGMTPTDVWPHIQNDLPDSVIGYPDSLQEVYEGSLKALLMRNLGNYVVATFLIGTQGTVAWEGILYDVGNDYLAIYQSGRDQFIVSDLYSLKYVEFYDTRRRQLCDAMLAGDQAG